MELADELAAVEATIQTLQNNVQGHSLTVQQGAGLYAGQARREHHIFQNGPKQASIMAAVVGGNLCAQRE